MRFHRQFALLLAVVVTALALSPTSSAAPESDSLLPQTVVAYVSVANAPEFDKHWDQTQFGKMLDDEIMQPFVEDLRKQLDNKFEGLEAKLGLTLDDLEGVPSGELSLSLVERPDRAAALVVTMDVTGHESQAADLLATIEKRFAARGGTKQDVEKSETTLHVFSIAAQERGDDDQVTVYFLKDGLLVGVDDRDEADDILSRFSNSATDSLKTADAYRATMDRCQTAAGDLAPELRWFVEPFGMVGAIRSLRDEKPRIARDDYAKLFAENGFDAIQGAGGYINLLVDGGIELLHRTSIYAPATQTNDPLRWELSMRMLQLPNVAAFEPQSWVPRMCACYSTLNLDIATAFDNVGPIFDALQGHQGAWANTLEGWEVDPYGAQINVRKEFIAHMGQRITVVTDYKTPISPESERSIFAIEATNEKELAASLAKWMKKEPDVERREINGIEVWERVVKKVELAEVAIPGFSSIGNEPPVDDEQERERVLPNSASCVALGHLLMASDIEYLREILAGFGQHERLASSPDYLQVASVLETVAPGERSAWSFSRTDEDFRPVYELVRQNKMPEAETMLGRLLNDLLTTDVEKEEHILRKQRIDGSKLPSFEAVRRYFGPAGRVLKSEQDGWLLSGALLNKQAQ